MSKVVVQDGRAKLEKPERPTCARCGRRLVLDHNGTGWEYGLGGACSRGGTCGPLNGVSIDVRDYRRPDEDGAIVGACVGFGIMAAYWGIERLLERGG